MYETSVSLLDHLRQEPDERAWKRLVDLYTPLIHGWLRQFPYLHNDTDDLVQEVLSVLVKKVGNFDRQRSGSFRRWLRNITVNCIREHCRTSKRNPTATGDSDFLQTLNALEDQHSDLSQLWDHEHHRHVTAHLLAQIRPRFEETTWRAFERVALDSVAPAEVARELGISVNAVFIAKSRVMSLLRKEGEGLLD